MLHKPLSQPFHLPTCWMACSFTKGLVYPAGLIGLLANSKVNIIVHKKRRNADVMQKDDDAYNQLCRSTVMSISLVKFRWLDVSRVGSGELGICIQGSQKDISGGHSRYWCQFKCHSLTINLSQGNDLICACMCKGAPFVLAKANNQSPNVNVKCYAGMGSVPIILIEKGRLENRMYNYFVMLVCICIC